MTGARVAWTAALSLAMTACGTDAFAAAETSIAAGCSTLASCVAIVSTPDVHAQRRTHALDRLESYRAAEVASALAPLLRSDLRKLREAAWWHADLHPAEWRPFLPALIAAAASDPEHLWSVAKIGGDAAWEPVDAIALSGSAVAPDFAAALFRIDRQRAIDTAFAAIRGDIDELHEPDGFVRGVFSGFSGMTVPDDLEARFEAIIVGEGPVEARRLAVVGLVSALEFSTDPVPAFVLLAYSEAPEAVRREIRRGFRHRVGTPAEHAADLPELLREDRDRALMWKADIAGPDGAAASPAIRESLHDRESRTRRYAVEALYAVDRAAWRTELPRLAASPDIEVVLDAREMAEMDSPESFALALEAGRGHWYPRLEEAWTTRRWHNAEEAASLAAWEAEEAAREAAGISERSGEDEDNATVIDTIELPTYVVYGETCPAAEDIDLPDSLFSSAATLAAAATYADVDTWRIGAAMRFGDGWLVGSQESEGLGAVIYTPDGQAGYRVARSYGREALMMYAHRGVAFVVHPGMWVDGGYSAELLRVDSVDGRMQATSLLQLPAPPTEAVIRDDRVLLRLKRNGWVDVSDPTAPRWLGCAAEPPPAGD